MKFLYLLKEMIKLIRRRKAYFLAPLLLMLLLLALLAFYIGPATIVTFIYAGI